MCDYCGAFFPAYEVEAGGPGVEVIEATVDVGPDVHVSNPCPACGGTGRVLSGVYNIVGDTLELLRGPEHTVSELDWLREARESGASAEEVGSTLRREFPGWGPKLAKLLVPKTPADFYALLAVILAAISVILQARQAGQTTNIEANQVINNTIVQDALATPGQPSVAPSAAPTSPSIMRTRRGGRKIGPNEQCPCGSGLKFKKCHGLAGANRYVEP